MMVVLSADSTAVEMAVEMAQNTVVWMVECSVLILVEYSVVQMDLQTVLMLVGLKAVKLVVN